MGRKVIYVVNTLSAISALLCCISMVLPWHKRLYLTAKVISVFEMETGLFTIKTEVKDTMFGWMLSLVQSGVNHLSGKDSNWMTEFRQKVGDGKPHDLRGVADYYCATTESQIGQLLFGNACPAFNAAYWCGVGTLICMLCAFVSSAIANGYAVYYVTSSPKPVYRRITQLLLFVPPVMACAWSGMWMYGSLLLDHPYQGSLLDDRLAKTASSTSGVREGYMMAASTTILYFTAAVCGLKIKNKGEALLKDKVMHEAMGLPPTGVPTPEEYGAAPSYGATAYNDPYGQAANHSGYVG
jgi:hypothetical protein